MEQTRGDSSFRPENARLELDGIRNGEIRNWDLNDFPRALVEVEPVKLPIGRKIGSSVRWRGRIICRRLLRRRLLCWSRSIIAGDIWSTVPRPSTSQTFVLDLEKESLLQLVNPLPPLQVAHLAPQPRTLCRKEKFIWEAALRAEHESSI